MESRSLESYGHFPHPKNDFQQKILDVFFGETNPNGQMEDFRSFCQTYVIGFGPGAILFSASSSPFFCNPNVGNRSGCTEDSFLREILLILGTGWSGY